MLDGDGAGHARVDPLPVCGGGADPTTPLVRYPLPPEAELSFKDERGGGGFERSSRGRRMRS